MLAHVLRLVLMLVLCVLSVPRPAAAQAPSIEGVWEGEYRCSAGWTALKLELAPNPVDPRKVDAVFNFGSASGFFSSGGSYTLSGKYNPSTRVLSLTPQAWIHRPPGYRMVGMSGRIDSTTGVFTGSITDARCGEFAVRKAAPPPVVVAQAEPPPAAAAPAGPQQVAASTPEQSKLDQYADLVIREDSRSWFLNSYVSGSARNSKVINSDAEGDIFTISTAYTYNQTSSGWANIKVQGATGKIVCLEFHDFPGRCRVVGQSPGQAIFGTLALGLLVDSLNAQPPASCEQFTKRPDGTLNKVFVPC